jgi:hypothetical protein
LDGFHKENERLSSVIKELETEKNMRIALFYDEREEMNKELNRLRNIYHSNSNVTTFDVKEGIRRRTRNRRERNDRYDVDGDNEDKYHNDIDDSNILKHDNSNNNHDNRSTIITNSKKSAETLRMELDMDSMIRTLKEKLLQSESHMNERERELQQIIDRLQNENIDYATKISYLTLQINNITSTTIINDKINTLEHNNKSYLNEINKLKTKLHWYVENQRLIDQIDDDNKKFKLSYQIMKQEFIKHGGNMQLVQHIINNEVNKLNETNSSRGDDNQHPTSTSSSSSSSKKNEHKNTNNNETSMISSSNHIILNNSYNSNHVVDKDKSSYSITTQHRTKNHQHRSFADIKKIK